MVIGHPIVWITLCSEHTFVVRIINLNERTNEVYQTLLQLKATAETSVQIFTHNVTTGQECAFLQNKIIYLYIPFAMKNCPLTAFFDQNA